MTAQKVKPKLSKKTVRVNRWINESQKCDRCCKRNKGEKKTRQTKAIYQRKERRSRTKNPSSTPILPAHSNLFSKIIRSVMELDNVLFFFEL